MAQTPDSHDLDKLTKWHDGLTSAADQEFPVCALFLASREDTRAHDIFRVYRTAFEEMGAGFHDLVIFGQHGASSTSAGLVASLNLSGVQIPVLALITAGTLTCCHTAFLPPGALPEGQSAEDIEAPWKKALETVREAVKAGTSLSLDGVTGLERRESPGGPLSELVGRVKRQVEMA
ncbi:MAG: hypothetical protein BZY87_00765 [SAR202 cluster bacterium Io17-Chloro-G6]|nr:MAG: hypothetical protein BZY87_00765 [SAR202 cluster bacterium Io17-Chloro-G6]